MDRELEKNPTWITVVAVAIADAKGRWLMHRRPFEKHHGGLWEFPGGKVERGETPREALVREVNEELGICLCADRLRPAGFAESRPGEAGPGIVILLYTAPAPERQPEALEGGEVGWFTPAEVLALDKPPLDVELAGRLLADR